MSSPWSITNDKDRLSKDQIDKMVADAEKFKEDDEKLKDNIDAKNELENYAYSVKSSLNDEKLKDKFSDSDKETLNSKVDEAISYCDSEHTTDEYKSKNNVKVHQEPHPKPRRLLTTYQAFRDRYRYDEDKYIRFDFDYTYTILSSMFYLL